MSAADYLPRLADSLIEDLFAELSALLIVGPRAAGKTTTGTRVVRTIVRLDVPREAAAFRADPDSALSAMREPLLLDEWQEVPGIMGAVRRAVDADPRPGRFILTGSAAPRRGDQAWSGIGRVVRVSMYGLTVRERLGAIGGDGFLERLATGDVSSFASPADPPDLVGYLDLALRGGFPEPAIRLGAIARQAWLESYVDQLVTRDAEGLGESRDPVLLRRYFEALSLNTAGLADAKTIYDAAGTSRTTAAAYERLLADLFVLERSPAWSDNKLSRLVRGAKRYVVDPSLAAAALRLDRGAVLRDGDVIGRLLDTFVAAQLRPEAALTVARTPLYHLREKDGRREVDILGELGDGGLVAIEVKATATPRADDARHLVWLSDRYGERFRAGAVLHTGPRPFVLGDRILALPICSLWS